MSELVSIFVPVYNISSRYPGTLERFLDSIRNQSYSNIEVILVDDGSTDDSATICDHWAQMDNRFHVVRHDTNMTINKARETGFRHCSGSLVFNADPDDLLHPQAIEIQHDLLANHPDCQMAVGPVVPHWGDTVDFAPIVNPDYEIIGQDTSIRRMFRNGNHTVWNKLYRRELLEHIDWDVTRINDFHLSLQIWLNASRFILVNEPTYYWIQRDKSITHINPGGNSVDKFDTLTIDWNRYIKDKHPEYYADFLYRAYAMATSGFDLLSDKNIKKIWHDKLNDFFALTWNDYVRCDAAFHEKAAMWCLKRFPNMKHLFSKLIHFFS